MRMLFEVTNLLIRLDSLLFRHSVCLKHVLFIASVGGRLCCCVSCDSIALGRGLGSARSPWLACTSADMDIKTHTSGYERSVEGMNPENLT